ncbi:BT_3987 domain-containing protein [Pedobacter sp. Leaf250]|uniref:BT_3987 domain-containing protein n=1 Tax=Pedobacter sp. Leaf250 TaxID=2876559 RepID=UPI001E4EDC7F|nr:DUF1735 domain-containing protein [Pedobacter sp. Leaf250]
MKNHFLKYAGIALLFAVTAISCRKDAFEGTETGDSGITHFKVLEGREVKLFFSPFTNIAKTPMFSIRRDAANNADLQQTNTIKLEQNAGIITKYNTDHAETYEELPASFYTSSSDAGYTKTATGYNVTFGPGAFSQNFGLNLDGSKWSDVSKKYAVAFRVTDWGGVKKTVATSDTILVLLSIKNAYDGIYSTVAGNVQRYSAPGVPTVGDALNGSLAGNPDVTLSTIGPNAVQISGLTWFGGTSGIAGIDNLQATVNPATNQVTMRALGNATLRNIAGADNKYDPATKTFTLNFEWNPTANARQVTGLVITYKGSR